MVFISCVIAILIVYYWKTTGMPFAVTFCVMVEIGAAYGLYRLLKHTEERISEKYKKMVATCKEQQQENESEKENDQKMIEELLARKKELVEIIEQNKDKKSELKKTFDEISKKLNARKDDFKELERKLKNYERMIT